MNVVLEGNELVDLKQRLLSESEDTWHAKIAYFLGDACKKNSRT